MATYYRVSFVHNCAQLFRKARLSIPAMDARAIAALIINDSLPDYESPSTKVEIPPSTKEAARKAWRKKHPKDSTFKNEWENTAHKIAWNGH